jgi:hypothetical protein
MVYEAAERLGSPTADREAELGKSAQTAVGWSRWFDQHLMLRPCIDASPELA